MADIDRIADRATDNVRGSLARLRPLVTGFVIITLVVCAATFATGYWVFDHHRTMWVAIGGVLCLIPLVAILQSLGYLWATLSRAPGLMGEITQLVNESSREASVLIDHDSGEPLVTSAGSFAQLRSLVTQRRDEFPALHASVRALTSVPGLLAITILGVVVVGLLGTVMFIVGLAR